MPDPTCPDVTWENDPYPILYIKRRKREEVEEEEVGWLCYYLLLWSEYPNNSPALLSIQVIPLLDITILNWLNLHVNTFHLPIFHAIPSYSTFTRHFWFIINVRRQMELFQIKFMGQLSFIEC